MCDLWITTVEKGCQSARCRGRCVYTRWFESSFIQRIWSRALEVSKTQRVSRLQTGCHDRWPIRTRVYQKLQSLLTTDNNNRDSTSRAFTANRLRLSHSVTNARVVYQRRITTPGWDNGNITLHALFRNASQQKTKTSDFANLFEVGTRGQKKDFPCSSTPAASGAIIVYLKRTVTYLLCNIRSIGYDH